MSVRRIVRRSRLRLPWRRRLAYERLPMSKEPEERLKASFCCAKCHARQAETRVVNFATGLPHLLSRGQGRYVLVSCVLCGYTEIYNLSAYALRPEEAPEASPVAHKP
jgi:predicted nucleic-acid-binding Zn-ribbon protein